MSDIMFLHSPHLRSPAVTALQTILRTRGYYHGTVDGEFGILTSQAVYRAKYWMGYPKPDHVAGPVLMSYLLGTSKTPASYRAIRTLRQRNAKKVSVGQRMLSEALTHLGTRESPPGSNEVLFSRWYGLVGSWCAMFVSFCGAKFSSVFKKGVHYAYVPYIVADARAGRNNLRVVHPSEVRPGDIVCYDWPGESPGLADHTGLFEKWEDEARGNFSAIEGNTSAPNDTTGSQSDGGGVFRRDRNTDLVQVFVRVTK